MQQKTKHRGIWIGVAVVATAGIVYLIAKKKKSITGKTNVGTGTNLNPDQKTQNVLSVINSLSQDLTGFFGTLKPNPTNSGTTTSVSFNQPQRPVITVASTSNTLLPVGYPIKFGSTGQLVRQLQTALGVTVDGIFGSQTETALLNKTGKFTVDTPEELSNIINS